MDECKPLQRGRHGCDGGGDRGAVGTHHARYHPRRGQSGGGLHWSTILLNLSPSLNLNYYSPKKCLS